MNVFYKPTYGVVGDCIPYFHDGRYHVFYLRNYRDPDSHGCGSPWHHVSTSDGVNFVDHGEALEKGSPDEQDPGVATGSVFTDDDGLHHIFYTGINPLFFGPDQHSQVILHATSTDLDTWTKDRAFALYPDEDHHERHDWRDPFVYRHPESGQPTMLVAARTREGEPSGRGCTAVLHSDDLMSWSYSHDYAPGRYHGHECPDLFQIGQWYYLVFSEYTTHTVTRYVMSRHPDGPWVAPLGNQFDNRAFYAAKSAAPGDGGPRYLFGWNPTKVDNQDDGEWQWGGCLTAHEIRQRTDGTLAVAPPQALADQFDQADSDSPAIRLDGVASRASVVLGTLPSAAMIDAELTFAGGTGTAGILLDVSEEGHGGYFLRLDADLGVAQFGKVGGYRSWFVDHFPELDRPISVEPGVPMSVRVIVDGSAVVAYIGDVALSARKYSSAPGHYGVFADGGVAAFTDVSRRGRRAAGDER